MKCFERTHGDLIS